MFTVVPHVSGREPASPRSHFSHTHSVASVARRMCRQTHHLDAAELLGGVACGPCFETAIRADERFAVEFDLPATVVPDHSYVDQVAVDRFISGEPVSLTGAEKREGARILRSRGLKVPTIARVLGVRQRFVRDALAQAPAGSVSLVEVAA